MNNMDYMEKIKIKKKFKNNIIEFPMENEIVSEKVIDINGDDKYLFDINRKQAISIRCTYQNRYNTNIQLLRLDINSKPHRNPDMKLISESHIHVYTEEYKVMKLMFYRKNIILISFPLTLNKIYILLGKNLKQTSL